jgi:hypothetical protein
MTSASAPIMVRNMEPGPTVFTAPGNGAHVEWQGAGDPQGLDMQSCPAEFLQLVAFCNALEKRIFEIVEDKDLIQETLSQHRNDWEQKQERRRNAGTDALEIVENKDMAMVNCIAPVAKGGKTCDVALSLKLADLSTKPPLCHEHQRFAGKFIAEETDKIVNGKPEVRWTLPRMQPLARQQ